MNRKIPEASAFGVPHISVVRLFYLASEDPLELVSWVNQIGSYRDDAQTPLHFSLSAASGGGKGKMEVMGVAVVALNLFHPRHEAVGG